MAYTKNTWATDDIITADKLNNMEMGIFNSQTTITAPFSDLNAVAANMIVNSGYYQIQGASNILNGPNGTIKSNGIIEVRSAGWTNAGFIDYLDLGSSSVYKGVVSGGTISWVKYAKDGEVVKLTGDQTVSGNKTFSGTTNTTGYLKQKRWSTTASIGGNTFILNRIGDVVFASGQVTTVLTGETTASGTLTTGFRPNANFVISTNRGVGTGTLLFQNNGSVWVPATVNVGSYISGTYLAEDTLPTI